MRFHYPPGYEMFTESRVVTESCSFIMENFKSFHFKFLKCKTQENASRNRINWVSVKIFNSIIIINKSTKPIFIKRN